MRHLKAGRALGVTTSHRRAMLRNMVTSLLEHERITTTLARAKELRKPCDHMITLGKRGDLAARRLALAFVRSKKAMAKLFGELAERYRDRPGGYSRIVRVAARRGDGAEMASVMLVGGSLDPFAPQAEPKRKSARKRAAKKASAQAEAAGAKRKTAKTTQTPEPSKATEPDDES